MKFHAKGLVLVALIAAVFVVYISVAGGGASMNKRESREVRLAEVDTDNLQAMSRWARRMCRGWTVEQMATAAGVEPTMESVLAELSEGFPAPASRVVRKVCEYELTRTKVE